jgi:hypothetical protein
MREKFNIVLEDEQKIYNKWVKGIAKQDAPSHVITVDDIVNKYRNTTAHEMIKQLPFGMESLLAQIGDIFSKTSQVRATLKSAERNPVVFQHKHRVDAVNSFNDKMDKIQQILFSCTVEMNKIVENSEKEDKI